MTNFVGPIYTPNVYITGDLYNDYLVPGLALGKNVSSPDLEDFRGGLEQNAFAGTGVTVEQGYFTVHILHDIKPETFPTFHIHCGHNIDSGTYTADSANVKWYLDYSICNGYGNEAFPAPTTLSTTIAMGSQYDHDITPDDMALTETIEPDMLILGRIYRDPADAADTFGYDCFLFQVDLHYQIGQIGTTERNRPFRRF